MTRPVSAARGTVPEMASAPQPGRSRSLYFLSPPALLLMAWTFLGLGVAWGYVGRNSLPVMVRTMQLNGIDFAFPVIGMVWVGICLLVVAVVGFAVTRPIPQHAKVINGPRDLSKALRIAALLHTVILIVVALWILLGAQSVGGFDRLIALAAEQDTYVAKEAILDNKLFPGMRLLYTGLIGLGVFGACVFAINLDSPARIRGDMKIGLGMFLASVVALSFLPIFLSQRILLVQMVLSAFVAVSMVRGRVVNMRYGLLLALLLFFVWSLREAVTVGPWASDFSAARVGGEKLLYYLVNDFYNTITPFTAELEKTYGAYSFKFLVYFSGLEDKIHNSVGERMALAEQFRAGGVFPAFTAPYVDFSWAGMIFVVGLVLLFGWVFDRAHRSFTFAVIYGQCGGAMLLTPHVAWYSHHNFTFNILMLVLICAFIRRQTAPASETGRLRGGLPA